MTIQVLEFYCGIGGFHLALSRTGFDAKVVRAFDRDQTACQVYEANYGKIIKRVDISTLTASDISPLKSNLWVLSPACQPYTVLNTNAKRDKDPRAQSFLYLVQKVLPELASWGEHPERLLVENVAGFESSSTRQLLLSTLRSIGYVTLELLLTPLQFDIPNSRLRYYLLAKKAPLSFPAATEDLKDHVWRHIPGIGEAWTDPRVDMDRSEGRPPALPVKEYLDGGDDHIEKLVVPDRVLERWGRLFDIVTPSSRRTCCFTRGYTQLVERAGSILQENDGLDTTTTFDLFLEAQSRGDLDAVKILYPLKLRYFSPGELLRIFAFDPPDSSRVSSFKWPATISPKSKYKLIGNSVNVRVIEELIKYLFDDKRNPTL